MVRRPHTDSNSNVKRETKWIWERCYTYSVIFCVLCCCCCWLSVIRQKSQMRTVHFEWGEAKGIEKKKRIHLQTKTTKAFAPFGRERVMKVCSGIVVAPSTESLVTQLAVIWYLCASYILGFHFVRVCVSLCSYCICTRAKYDFSSLPSIVVVVVDAKYDDDWMRRRDVARSYTSALSTSSTNECSQFAI